MPQMYLCPHLVGLLIRAVEGYDPTEDEGEDHSFLLDFLKARAESPDGLDTLSPEDIPF
jgi:hypothetical protein